MEIDWQMWKCAVSVEIFVRLARTSLEMPLLVVVWQSTGQKFYAQIKLWASD